MTTKKLIEQVLEKWEFPILESIDNSVLFRYQMSYIQANATDNEDSRSATLSLSGFFTADNEKELLLCLHACNDVNHNLIHVKAYVDSDSALMITSEFFFKTEDDFEHLMNMSLRTMITAKRRFARKYEELEAEAKLISELEEE